MSATTVRLLQAASDLLGGSQALSDHLGITERLLAKYMADRVPLPDSLLLRTVDIILADRQTRRAAADGPAVEALRQFVS